MDFYLNYGGSRISFSLPSDWNVLSSRDCVRTSAVQNVAVEVDRALDSPIGTLPLEQMARSGMKAAVLFDDMQRATPAHIAIPAIMNRLNKAGISDEQITKILDTHHHPFIKMNIPGLFR
jgi:lactate racemase